MVCAVDHLAAQAGLAMLQAGGSAADAAVATSAVLAVTSQHMCGMGGDLLAVVSGPDGHTEPLALNASGRAGSGADPDRLRREGYTAMPFRNDIRSVPIPGCVDGWLALHERLGRLPLADVLAPARRYATDGFPASPTLAAAVPLVSDLPEAAEFTGSKPIKPGTLIQRPGVARALDAIVSEGRAGFYQGEFGKGLLTLGAGEYTPDDLERPLADWVAALGTQAWGHRIWTVPPNSQGYLTLAGAWLADALDLPGGPDGPDDPRWAHLLIEAARQAGYDRNDVLYERADGAALIDPDRLANRLAAIQSDRAAAVGGVYQEGGTIALCAIDRDRLGVCVVQSNAAGFGSHLIVPGVRIFLQNRGIGFSLEPGHPGEYGPGRRPSHTLCPTLVTRPDGSLAAVVGTMGGDGQPQILLQLLARSLFNGQSPGHAMAAGRWTLTSRQTDGSAADAGGGTGFDTWRERGVVDVLVEGHATPEWTAGLESRGHRVVPAPPFSRLFGFAHLISVEDDHLAGATDPRPLFGAAAGY
jgi:gamma-glutamyltranspeptidase/glutathione hydrolase